MFTEQSKSHVTITVLFTEQSKSCCTKSYRQHQHTDQRFVSQSSVVQVCCLPFLQDNCCYAQGKSPCCNAQYKFAVSLSFKILIATPRVSLLVAMLGVSLLSPFLVTMRRINWVLPLSCCYAKVSLVLLTVTIFLLLCSGYGKSDVILSLLLCYVTAYLM